MDWIGAFLKCKPSYLMRGGIKECEKENDDSLDLPQIAKSAPVILVEEVGWVLLFVWEALSIARHHRFIKG